MAMPIPNGDGLGVLAYTKLDAYLGDASKGEFIFRALVHRSNRNMQELLDYWGEPHQVQRFCDKPSA